MWRIWHLKNKIITQILCFSNFFYVLGQISVNDIPHSPKFCYDLGIFSITVDWDLLPQWMLFPYFSVWFLSLLPCYVSNLISKSYLKLKNMKSYFPSEISIAGCRFLTTESYVSYSFNSSINSLTPGSFNHFTFPLSQMYSLS